MLQAGSPWPCRTARFAVFPRTPEGSSPSRTFTFRTAPEKCSVIAAGKYARNTSFEQVVRACSNRRETWIDETIIQSYLGLNRAGHAHSLEVWREGMLAGGLYGVQIGGAFFGESMFHHVPGASKVALIVLATRLKTAGFQLLDTQWTTPHLAQFGAISIPRREYLQRLQSAIRTNPHGTLE